MGNKSSGNTAAAVFDLATLSRLQAFVDDPQLAALLTPDQQQWLGMEAMALQRQACQMALENVGAIASLAHNSQHILERMMSEISGRVDGAGHRQVVQQLTGVASSASLSAQERQTNDGGGLSLRNGHSKQRIVLSIIADDDEMATKDIIEQAIGDKALNPSGKDGRGVDARISAILVTLKGKGLVESVGRGRWRITEQGKNALAVSGGRSWTGVHKKGGRKPHRQKLGSRGDADDGDPFSRQGGHPELTVAGKNRARGEHLRKPSAGQIKEWSGIVYGVCDDYGWQITADQLFGLVKSRAPYHGYDCSELHDQFIQVQATRAISFLASIHVIDTERNVIKKLANPGSVELAMLQQPLSLEGPSTIVSAHPRERPPKKQNKTPEDWDKAVCNVIGQIGRADVDKILDCFTMDGGTKRRDVSPAVAADEARVTQCVFDSIQSLVDQRLVRRERGGVLTIVEGDNKNGVEEED